MIHFYRYLRVSFFCITAFMLFGLSGCATLPAKSASVDNFNQLLTKEDQKQFDQNMNVAKDGEMVSWRNEEEGISFQLTAEHPSINESGEVCREYHLVIDQDYQRKQFMNATACRDSGSWES